MKRSLQMVTTKQEIVHLYNDLTLGKFVVHYLPHNNRGEYTMKFQDVNEATKMMEQIVSKVK